MTPGARVQAAIDVLDRIAAGAAAEQALTHWARQSRFAGSKDRLAVRDYVYDVLRRWRSTAAAGGAETGRARMIGLLRLQGIDPEALFTGDGHAPAPLASQEAPQGGSVSDPVAYDCPDWLWPILQQDQGTTAPDILAQLQTRAPVFLRINLARASVAQAQQSLGAEGIETQAVENIKTALLVTGGERKISQSQAYLTGLVDLQDASSQAACLALNIAPKSRGLDYCAGGGGKSLALAALGAVMTAHDVNPRRMADLGPRSERAGAIIKTCATVDLGDLAPFDFVLCDAPCSGSGTWRRAPDAKWALDPGRLADLVAIQADVLRSAAPLVRAGGVLAYATCSVLTRENQAQITSFLAANPMWTLTSENSWLPGPSGDGFYLAVMRKN